RITSLAFNLTGVDVTEDMGPFEVAPGTQWDDGRAWNHEMFPAKQLWSRFEERAVRKWPQMGDISCRSALTVHRGTAHTSPIARRCSSSAWMHPERATISCTTLWSRRISTIACRSRCANTSSVASLKNLFPLLRSMTSKVL